MAGNDLRGEAQALVRDIFSGLDCLGREDAAAEDTWAVLHGLYKSFSAGMLAPIFAHPEGASMRQSLAKTILAKIVTPPPVVQGGQGEPVMTFGAGDRARLHPCEPGPPICDGTWYAQPVDARRARCGQGASARRRRLLQAAVRGRGAVPAGW